MNFFAARKSYKRLAYYGVIYSSYLFRALSFIILAPVLSRVLDSSEWGVLLSAQTLGIWLSVILEYGFSLSFSRKVTVHIGDKEKVASLVSQVMSAKILILPVTLIITFLISLTKSFHGHLYMAWLGLLWAAVQSFTPIWYFQATESLYRFSILDSVLRILYILAVVVLVRIAPEPSTALILMIVSSLVVCIFSVAWMVKDIDRKLILSTGEGWIAIKEGSQLAVFTLITSLYSSASLIILGIFTNASLLAVYGNADRLVRSGLSLIAPINQVILPRSAKAFSLSNVTGSRFVRKVLIAYFSIGALMSVVGWFFAPLVVNIVFGGKYLTSIFYFRMLLILLPLTAVNTVFVYHFLIPTNKDKIVNTVYVIASIISIVLMVVLIPRLSLNGMTIAVIVPEVFAILTLSFMFIVFSRNMQEGAKP